MGVVLGEEKGAARFGISCRSLFFIAVRNRASHDDAPNTLPFSPLASFSATYARFRRYLVQSRSPSRRRRACRTSQTKSSRRQTRRRDSRSAAVHSQDRGVLYCSIRAML